MNVLKPVSTIMTPNPLTVQVDDRLSIVSQLFANNKIHHLPVVDKEMLVGIISKSDFLLSLIHI